MLLFREIPISFATYSVLLIAGAAVAAAGAEDADLGPAAAAGATPAGNTDNLKA